NQGRDLIKRFPRVPRILGTVEFVPISVQDLKPRAIFFFEEWKHTLVGEFLKLGCDPSLVCNLEALSLEGLDDLRNLCIAEPCVVRPILGKDDAVTFSVLEPEAHIFGGFGEHMGLQPRIFKLVPDSVYQSARHES